MDMEIFDASILRKAILDSSIPFPIIFKKLHADWTPLQWSSQEFCDILVKDSDEKLQCRLGKINYTFMKPQWESQTRTQNMTWDELRNFISDDEWVYYDYKRMRDVVKPEFLKSFNWGKVGFPERDGSESNLWIGSKDSYTPCHYDTYGSNLITQIVGEKIWLLFPPSSTKDMRVTRIPYEESSVYSQIDFSSILKTRQLLNQNHHSSTSSSSSVSSQQTEIQGLKIKVEAGDVLYIPPNWWHFVQSQSWSISCNTWIELAQDAKSRVSEAILRTITASFLSISSPDSVLDILNPNEDELLDTDEESLNEILKKSLEDYRNFLISQKDNSSSEGSSNSIDYLLKFPIIQKLEKFSFTDLNSTTIDNNINNLKSTSSTHSSNFNDINYVQHVLNAIAQPEVLKLIQKEFLQSISENK